MKLILLLTAGLGPLAALAQSITLSPAANALAAPRTTSVAVTLAVPPAPGAMLKVFSSLVGGQKAGVLTTTRTGLSFQPTTAFKAGETLFASYSTGTGTGRVWQFTAAAAGSGTFGGGSDFAQAAYPYGTTLLNIAVGDLTTDGNLDIVGAEIGTNGSPTFTTNGTGQLLNLPVYLFSFGYTLGPFPPFGDVDGDGLLDLVTSRNTGLGKFVGISNPTFPAGYNYGGAQADFDGDGDLDYAYNGYNFQQGLSSLHLAVNNGRGTYSFNTPAVTLARDGLLSAGDLDGDGDIDLVHFSASSRPLAVLLNDGHGAFSVGPSYVVATSSSGVQVHRVVLGDVDGDGDLDMLVPTVYDTTLWLNNGSGGFAKSSNSGLGYCSSMSVGDVDSDGDLDVLVGGGSTQIFLNNGTGAFSTGYRLDMLASGGALLADMNNDGALDVVAAKSGATPGNPGTGQPGILSVRLNNAVVTATQTAVAVRYSVWPNPLAIGEPVHIEAPAGAVSKITHLSLSTITGQRVSSRSFTGAGTDLPTAGLAAGLYLLCVQAENQSPLTYRVAVK